MGRNNLQFFIVLLYKKEVYIHECYIHGFLISVSFIVQCFSSLRMLVEKPPITGKEVTNLSASAMAGFRLTPGAVPEPYR